jgi:hypothetical protein
MLGIAMLSLNKPLGGTFAKFNNALTAGNKSDMGELYDFETHPQFFGFSNTVDGLRRSPRDHACHEVSSIGGQVDRGTSDHLGKTIRWFIVGARCQVELERGCGGIVLTT